MKKIYINRPRACFKIPLTNYFETNNKLSSNKSLLKNSEFWSKNQAQKSPQVKLGLKNVYGHYCFWVGRTVVRSSLEREVWSSNLGPVKSGTISQRFATAATSSKWGVLRRLQKETRIRKLISSPNHAWKNPKVKLGMKTWAMLPSNVDYIFVHLIQKVRPELSPKFWLTSGPPRKAPPDLQLCT